MIFVTDKGRMANNILQYGHLYAWGREHGRTTMSMRFAYKYHDFHICHTPHHNFLTYLAGKYAAKMKLIPTVDFNNIDSDYRLEQQTMLSHRHLLATGWCVRFPGLFLKYKSEIQALFAFDDSISTKVDSILQPFRARLILGVHVRRGDYAHWCHGRYFFDDSEYLRVIKEFIRMKAGQDVQVMICGNDPQLDKACYRQALGNDRVTFPQGSATEDLCLLSRCDALIGPPSSFSLIASMYRDTPLHWMTDKLKPLEELDFKTFDTQFRQFDSYYIE